MSVWDVRFFSPVYFPIMEEDPLNTFNIPIEDQMTYVMGSPDLLLLENGTLIAYDDFGNEDKYGTS